MNPVPGIYKIQSIIKPERVYIGSAINLHRRKITHLSDLRNNCHGNNKLQNHFNKYGEKDLVFSFVAGCDKSELLKNEQWYIDIYNPWFNNAKIAGNCLGVKHSLEYCKNISNRMMGRIPWNKGKKNPYSKEAIQKMREAACNRKHTQETKDKISKITKGRKLSEEHKKKIGEFRKGCIISEKQRQSIIESNKKRKGCKFSEEHKRKIGLAQIGNKNSLGRIVSEETRRRISEKEKETKGRLGTFKVSM